MLGAEDRNRGSSGLGVPVINAAPGFARRRGSEPDIKERFFVAGDAAPGFARRRGSELAFGIQSPRRSQRRRRALLGAEDRNGNDTDTLTAGLAAAPGFARRRGSERRKRRGPGHGPAAAPGFARRRGSEQSHQDPEGQQGLRRRRALLGAEDRNAQRWCIGRRSAMRRRALLGAEDRNPSTSAVVTSGYTCGAGLCSAPRIGTSRTTAK